MKEQVATGEVVTYIQSAAAAVAAATVAHLSRDT